MQATTALSSETVLTFGIRRGAGFATVAANNLSPHEVKQLFMHLDELARKVQGNLAVDMAMVNPMNCGWINAMIELHQRCKSLGGQFIVAGLPADAADIVRSTGLDKKLMLSSTGEDAMRFYRLNETPKVGLLGKLLGQRAA
jgi:anti-anti-sigma regulatory factor